MAPLYTVTVYRSTGGDPAGISKDMDAAPSLNGRSVPTLVATTFIGVPGSRKSFCCWDLLPGSLLIVCQSTLDLVRPLGRRKPTKYLLQPLSEKLRSLGL